VIIDAHCHGSSRWYEPVETLLFRMDACGVERAVLIQLLGSIDSRDMVAARSAHPDRFAFVAAIDAQATNAIDQVRRAVDAGAAGLRLRPTVRSAGDDPLAIWRQAGETGLAISCVGPAAEFVSAGFGALLDALPGLPIVLEHLGGLGRPDVGDRGAALVELLGLATYRNISLKLPGLGQLAPRVAAFDETDPPIDLSGIDALLASVLEVFGPNRLMWGSDFPPVAAREGYANALVWTRDVLNRLAPGSIDAAFGDTAARIFFGR